MVSHLLWEQGFAGSSPVWVTYPDGVTVAQEFLVLLVGVQIPVGVLLNIT